MLPARVAEVAAEYQAAQRRLTESALGLVSQAVQVSAGKPDRWVDAVSSIGAQLLTLQVAAVALADGYLDDVLEAQGADRASDGKLVPAAFADLTDGGGSWLLNLVYAPNSLVTKGSASGAQLANQFRHVAFAVTAAGVQDMGRSAAQTAMQTRRAVRGYTRMLHPPSCARCAILAGRMYRSRTAFKRHPHCDCVHIPTAEDSGGWTTNSSDYFESLDAAEQDRIFTKAGAEAIRLSGGSETTISQVVNARQGMTTVQAYGQTVQATTSGVTVRGLAGQRLAAEGAAKSGRFRAATVPRLMPDEIFQLADEGGWDRAEVLRQLRRFGYVL